ncbi:MAG: hypothetical protein AAF944_27410 [Bacteroidota bacterium]
MNSFFCYAFIISGAIFFPSRGVAQSYELIHDTAFSQAATNGVLFNEGLERCQRFVAGWLQQADPETGLIPRNLQESNDIWNAKDAAADNYPFMVLTAALTDQSLLEGKMMDMLRTETKLTSRWDALPDTYSFVKNDFAEEQFDTAKIMFGASEYIKDGLLPLTEWLGASPWSERMISILDDMWKHAPIETPHGNVVSTNVEVNGEMLQTLARIYWMTGDQKYLNWAIRLGDYYLLDKHHPTQNFESLRLRDHGCEIVSGLCELYATVHFAFPEKKEAYQRPLHTMLDRILKVGRNEHGLFYNVVNPQTGEVLDKGIADNFGYTLNGFYTVYQIDSTEAHRQAILKALNSLNGHYRNFDWEHGSSDGYADAIEGALNLYNREPVVSVAQWLDSETKVMWAMQQKSGIIEGWHGDGNFARTTIMYCLWKSQGVTAAPWRSDIKLGAVREGNNLLVSLTVDQDWKGKLVFCSPRHQTVMHLPTDWPRINQFPEWFTAEKDQRYEVVIVNQATKEVYTSIQLQNGIPFNAEPGKHRFLVRKME